MAETPNTSTLPPLLKMPGFVRFGIRIDSAATWRWLALLAVALWPTWWWLGRRMLDGTDDALSALALATLLASLWQHRARLRAAPRLGFQVSALAGAVLTTALYHQAPDGVLGLIGVASLTAGLLAFLPAQVATAPVLGLAVLSLPLLVPLQTYAGQPLHVVWLGLFTACAVALVAQRSNPAFIVRLPVVGVLLVLGHFLHTAVCDALQTSATPAKHGLQTALGLLVLASVCAGIGTIMGATLKRNWARTP